MKRSLSWLAPFFLAHVAAAQVLPGVEISATPLQAPPGKPIVLELVNHSNELVNVHCDGLWQRVFAGPGCSGQEVRWDPWVCAAFQTLNIGESAQDTWDQLDEQGQQVPPGTYSLDVIYWNYGGLYKDCITVTLTAGPETSAYCTAGTSAAGCQATLSTAGVASASAGSGFTLTAAAVEGRKNGLFFFGANGRQALPWGNGSSLQCVVPPIRRAGPMIGQGTAGSCDGSFSEDLNALWCASCPKPQANPGSGAVVQAQLWYRDSQSTSNQPTSLSDAVEFCVLP